MKKQIIVLLSVLGLITAFGFFYVKKDFQKAPPTLYYNGNIITMDDDNPRAQYMLVVDGKIVEIGSDIENLKELNLEFNKIDLDGKTILPGFIDVHTHFALTMFLENMVDLSGFKHNDNKGVWEYLELELSNNSEAEWIVGKGLDPILVADLETPSIQFMDSLCPNKPLVIFSQSLHSYWANSKAFEKAGINKKTKDPSGHSFYQKDEYGNLTGLIVEQEAFKPFIELLKEEVFTPSELSQASVKVMKGYMGNGNTTIVSTGLTINDSKPLILTSQLSEETLSLFNGLLEKIGQLPKRAPQPRHFIYLRHDMEHLMPRQKEENDFHKIIGIKHWYDGSPYTGSMYMSQPYLENPLSQNVLDIPKGSKGKALLGKESLKAFISKYHNMGWQIAIHTQGDAAITEVVEAYESLESSLDFSESRHRIEHGLMLPIQKLDDIKRLNLNPSFHINHLYYYGDALNSALLGPERANKLLPLKSTMDKGIVSTLHADQPMFESKPFSLIQTAVERKTKKGLILGKKERISLREALKSLTVNAAWQIGMENKLGSLEKGKYADFIIVDKDPFKTKLNKLNTIKCLNTFINGNRAN